VPFVGKTHRDAVFAEGPDFLDKAVVKLTLHLRVRNASMAARPSRNSERLRQRLSVL
jgi:hypothetical protein